MYAVHRDDSALLQANLYGGAANGLNCYFLVCMYVYGASTFRMCLAMLLSLATLAPHAHVSGSPKL